MRARRGTVKFLTKKRAAYYVLVIIVFVLIPYLSQPRGDDAQVVYAGYSERHVDGFVAELGDEETAEQPEHHFRRRPFGLIYRGQQVLDKVLEQRSKVFFAFHSALLEEPDAGWR